MRFSHYKNYSSTIELNQDELSRHEYFQNFWFWDFENVRVGFLFCHQNMKWKIFKPECTSGRGYRYLLKRPKGQKQKSVPLPLYTQNCKGWYRLMPTLFLCLPWLSSAERILNVFVILASCNCKISVAFGFWFNPNSKFKGDYSKCQIILFQLSRSSLIRIVKL